MSWVVLLPVTTGSINLAACIGYMCVGDWKRSLYWLCACIMTAMVTL